MSGKRAAARVEPGGADGGGNRLTHGQDRPFKVETKQKVTGLSRGWWTLSAQVKAGGGLDASRLELTGCGTPVGTELPLTEQDDQWVRLAVSTYVTGRVCTVSITTSGPAGAWASIDDIAVSPGQVSHEIRGVDLSQLAKNEANGAVYRDSKGRPGDPVALLAASGANLGRLKVWVDPADGYNDIDNVVATARRIKAAKMDLLIDFHYSDTWADPGAQEIPAAWRGLTPAQLADQVYTFTRETLLALQRAGIRTDYVQVGNEINSGMLHPYGQTYDVNPADDVSGAQFDNLAAFLKAGYRAVKDVDQRTQTYLHLTNINNGIGGLTWWFDEITKRGVPFDRIGLSYYGYWHGSLADLQEAVSTLSDRYDRDVTVLETSYPFTLEDDPNPAWENSIDLPEELVPGYPATPQGQAAQFRAVQDVTVSAAGGRGLGAVYWEPAWTSVPGNGWDPSDPSTGNAWENQAFFDYDGKLLPVARELAPR